MTRAPATDGCGVPCWVLSVEAMAKAWQKFARAIHDNDGTLGAIGHAMRQHPELVSGTNRLDLAVAQASQGRAISKVGAAGLVCVALPEIQASVALKVHSGNAQARAIACRQVLHEILGEHFDASHPWFAEQTCVRNVVGDVVGTVATVAP